MASVIANEFTEATGKLYLSALIEIALVLFIDDGGRQRHRRGCWSAGPPERAVTTPPLQ